MSIEVSKQNLGSGGGIQPSWYRGWIQGKTRILLAWIFAIGIGFFARKYPSWPGVSLCFVGASIRYWASGYLRKDLRPAVGGPYAWVRNPLYLGTYLMALGCILAIEHWLLLGLTTVIFAAIYHYIILDEENKLKKLFGASYLEYCQIVPRFFPALRPDRWPLFSKKIQLSLYQVNTENTHHHFSADLAHQNKAYEAYLSFLGLILFLVIAASIWQRI
jgi:protein-S-isoprenylcysteine O-methyltransferase Ste14